MARLITKFKYLKPDERNHFGGYAEYIATREGVEKIDESKRNAPATNKQKQLIRKILSDFPDSRSSLEYEDYLKDKTVGTASEFITRALEENADEMMHTKTYADYIATRPRAERFGSHGLFTDDGVAVNLQKVSDELNAHTGNVWTAIVSLRREDAERLGYDNGSRWRDMLRSQAQTLSENLRIPMSNLRWFAAFHNESHHPHIHLIAYSINPNEGYLSEKGVMALRSSFAKDIFAQDLLCEYKKQTEHRDALKVQSRDILSELIAKINGGTYDNPQVEDLLQTLAKGDAIINKTYITDCISKKVRVNNGERPKYYVENSHPAIIDSSTFGRVQEELARRSGKRKISRKAKTEQGKYSSKYALTELLVCGECKSAYRRCTWTASGKKKIVWRCINRIEYAKKYCHNSPSVEESVLQWAVMAAIMETANQNAEVLRTLKLHIGMGLAGEKNEDNSIDLQIRIAEIDAEFKKMLDRVSTDTIEAFDEETATRLMNEKSRLQQQLDNIADAEQRRENAKSRLDDIYTILDGIKNRPMEYDDQIVRQLLECVVVDSKEQITVIFKGGLKSVQPLTE